MKTCCIFSHNTAWEAIRNSDFETVEDFGGEGEGYSWSDGSRKLCRCKNCNALFLKYKMRFLAMSYDSDYISYSYYLPVASREEAVEYMDKYLGTGRLADSYDKTKIWFDGSKWSWKK